MKTNAKGKQVCVVIGATSKWQSDGRNTLLAHGHAVDDSDVEVGVRWGVGGAIAGGALAPHQSSIPASREGG